MNAIQSRRLEQAFVRLQLNRLELAKMADWEDEEDAFL